MLIIITLQQKNYRYKNKNEQINFQKDSKHYNKFYYHNQY